MILYSVIQLFDTYIHNHRHYGTSGLSICAYIEYNHYTSKTEETTQDQELSYLVSFPFSYTKDTKVNYMNYIYNLHNLY